MEKKSSRLSMERRFIFSILWVGVIPMGLALLIGYFAAREAQQRTVLRNLQTNARKTAAGIRLVVQERERLSMRIAHSPEIIHYLRAYNAGKAPSEDAVQERFHHEASISQSLKSFYSIYDLSGTPCVWMEGSTLPEPLDLKKLPKFGFINLTYSNDLGRYAGKILSPINDPDDGTILGYLCENQSVNDLLGFILEAKNQSEDKQENHYEVIFFSPTLQFTVILREDQPEDTSPPLVDKVDPRLAEKLTKSEGSQDGAFFLWNYTSGGESKPVLMAYSRLVSYFPVYVAVHLPAWRVFSTINIAAFIALLVSALVIGTFCLIAYRIINNNILRPISLVNEGAQIIRQGDFSLKLRINTGDEIEELATSFNQMAATLRNNIRHLKESEEKYRNLVLSIRDGMFQADVKDRVIFINPAGASILGFNAFEDVLEKHLEHFFVDEEDYTHIYDSLTKTSYVQNVRVWLKRRDGEKACVELSISRAYDEEGIFIGTAGSFRDVTRNVRLEQEVVDRAERIASINQIANVVNSSVEAGLVYENLTKEVRRMAEFDYAAVALSLNENTFETRQLYPEQTGEEARFPRMDDDNSWAGLVAQKKGYLLVEDIQTSTLPITHQFPPFVRSILCVPLYARNGLIGVLAFGSREIGGYGERHAHLFEEIAPHLTAALRNAQLLENLTHSLEEVNQAREKLRQANTELKSLDEMKTELLSNVSHELRTPLVSIMGYTDMLLNNKAGIITDIQREYLDIMMRNTEKLSDLIDNLLDFSKLYHGSAELLPTPFDVIDCIQASIKMVKPVADGKSIALKLTIHDFDNRPVEGPVLVKGDKGKLGQVFNNLLSNAVKFNDNGGTVTVDASLRNTEVTFSVTDTGIGIPKEAQEKIFSRFYQYDSSSKRKYPGTGIGLSIAQDIVRLHGGRITVHSQPGHGATFRFTLPIYMPPVETGENGQATVAPVIQTQLLAELVSQDRALIAQVRQVLRSESVDVIVASRPSEACAMAQKYNPDCIIVDIESDFAGNLLMGALTRGPLPPKLPLVLLCDEEAFSNFYQDQISARVKRNFRKSMLLSGIHYALTQQERSKTVQGNRILYVDDDAEAGAFIKRCLDDEGYEVDCCSTGEEALTLLEKGGYWLILLEIALPDINGWEVCKRIRENDQLSGIKVYIVTGRAIEEQTARTSEICSDGFLLKPFMAQDILMAVNSLAINRNRP